jgi:hypothetical protein
LTNDLASAVFLCVGYFEALVVFLFADSVRAPVFPFFVDYLCFDMVFPLSDFDLALAVFQPADYFCQEFAAFPLFDCSEVAQLVFHDSDMAFQRADHSYPALAVVPLVDHFDSEIVAFPFFDHLYFDMVCLFLFL